MKEKILEILRTGDTEAALNALLHSLSEEGMRASQALKTARMLEAEFSRLREDQLQNIIDADTAEARLNSINKRILDLLDLFEKEKVAPLAHPALAKKWPVGVLIAVLLIASLVIWKTTRPDPPQPPVLVQTPPYECPVFDETNTLRISILPFLNLTQREDVPMHLGLQDEINALIHKLSYPGNSLIIKPVSPKNEYLTFDGANTLRDSCGANLLIWGKYSSSTSGGNPLIDVRFVMESSASPQQEGVDSLLEHRNQAELSANLKTVATLLLAQAFLSQNRADLALALAGQITGSSPNKRVNTLDAETKRTQSDAYLIMAEAYQMMDQPEKAVSSYKEVLRHTPDNPTALTNKAVLDFKANRLKEAEKQTDKALEVHPEQINLHLLRAKIFEERGETTKAQAAIKVFKDETREKAKRDSLDTIPVIRVPKKSQ